MFHRLMISLAVLSMVAVAASAADENPIVTLVKSKVKEPTRPFAMVIGFKVKAGQEKAFMDAFSPAVAATRKEPGCIAYTLHRDGENPEQFVMYEQFKNIDALNAHAKEKYVETLLGTIVPLLDGAPKVSVYTVISE